MNARLAQDCLSHLEAARKYMNELGEDCTELDASLIQMRNIVLRNLGWSDGHHEARRRVRITSRTEHSAPRSEYFIFLDECGIHDMTSVDPLFPVFCLCAVIVSRDEFALFDRRWKTWKAEWLGSWQERVHEPDVRRRSRRFHDDDPDLQQARIDSLASHLSSLNFTCIAAIIDKDELQQQFPDGRIDEFLPASTYLMCINFVFERVVHFLYEQGNDAYGLVISEARGLREDAEAAAEFLRLQLYGTQFISERYFRNQLRPYIEFRRKDRNDSGLQVADLMARPVAEKAIEPGRTPERWQVAAAKLYDGGMNRRSSYGLKLFPSRDIRALFGETPN